MALALLSAAAGGPVKPEPPPPIRIEPGNGAVPANHLKFYLHFNSPMERGGVFRHLRLVETDGDGTEIAEVPEPFREVELWDESFTRLTLWFHPGRQKPGVNLNLEMGPILEPGKRYALEISGSWRAESGKAIGGNVIRHEFSTLPLDDTQPDPASWTINGFPQPLIQTDDLLDPASLQNSLTVETEEGQALQNVELVMVMLNIPAPPGIATGIRLKSRVPWPPGRYRLVVAPKLEDLAGNSVARPFNVDLEKQPGFKERTESVLIPFEIPQAPVGCSTDP